MKSILTHHVNYFLCVALSDKEQKKWVYVTHIVYSDTNNNSNATMKPSPTGNEFCYFRQISSSNNIKKDGNELYVYSVTLLCGCDKRCSTISSIITQLSIGIVPKGYQFNTVQDKQTDKQDMNVCAAQPFLSYNK